MTAWNAENIALLSYFATNKDMTAEQIGRHLGFSRNAILGKLNRLGIKKDNPSRPTSRAYAKRCYRNPIKIRKPKVIITEVTYADPIGTDAAPVLRNILFIDSRRDECRYVTDETPHARRICGDTTRPGKSWCPAHCALVYRPLKAEAA